MPADSDTEKTLEALKSDASGYVNKILRKQGEQDFLKLKDVIQNNPDSENIIKKIREILKKIKTYPKQSQQQFFTKLSDYLRNDFQLVKENIDIITDKTCKKLYNIVKQKPENIIRSLKDLISAAAKEMDFSSEKKQEYTDKIKSIFEFLKQPDKQWEKKRIFECS
jgi:hypothetical protein